MPLRTGGRAIVDVLLANDVDTVYCVPGESYIAVLDALYDAPSIRVIACRHEAAAANMAEAYGKLTGRPGICMVTRAPGATHASIGVHTARQDSTPMILFVGQVARGMQGREAFQEIDYAQVFGGLAKWARQIDDADRIPELVTRAFRVAMSGRSGPVVLALPEDVLTAQTDAPAGGPATRSAAHPSSEQLAQMRSLLAVAQRPLVVLGGSGWDEAACAALRRFAARNALPVACTFRRQALFDNRDPHYAGDLGLGPNPALAGRVRDADLILAVGTRLERDPDQRIYADRGAAAQAAADPRSRRSRRARPRVRARAGDQRRAGGVRARARGPRAGRIAALERMDDRCAPRLRAHLGARRERPPRRSRPGRTVPQRAAARGRDRVQRRGQLQHLAAPLLSVTNASARSSDRPAARWVTASRRRSRQSCAIPTER